MPRNHKGIWGNVYQEYLDTIAARGAPTEVLAAEGVIDTQEHAMSCALLGVPLDWADLKNYTFNTPYRVNEPNWTQARVIINKVLPHVNVLNNYWNNSFSLQIKKAVEALPKAIEQENWGLAMLLREVWRCGVIYLTWMILPSLLDKGWYKQGNLAPQLTLSNLPTEPQTGEGPSEEIPIPEVVGIGDTVVDEIREIIELKKKLFQKELEVLTYVANTLSDYAIVATPLHE